MRKNVRLRESVDAVVRMYAEGASKGDIAQVHGCCRDLIWKVVKGALSPEFRAAVQCEAYRMGGMLNKNKFQPDHHSPTEYRKGEIRGAAARRYLPLGTIRVRTLYGKPWYRAIKVRETPYGSFRNWEPVAVAKWRLRHGPIPKGMFVVPIDGDRMNDAEYNLELISRVEMLKRSRRLRPKKFAGRYVSRRTKKQFHEKNRVRRRTAMVRRQKLAAMVEVA